MNAHKYDDLSFKLLSLTILAGVLIALIDPAAKPATAKPEAQPTIQSTPTAPLALAAKIDPAPTAASVATPEGGVRRVRGHRHNVEKS